MRFLSSLNIRILLYYYCTFEFFSSIYFKAREGFSYGSKALVIAVLASMKDAIQVRVSQMVVDVVFSLISSCTHTAVGNLVAS